MDAPKHRSQSTKEGDTPASFGPHSQTAKEDDPPTSCGRGLCLVTGMTEVECGRDPNFVSGVAEANAETKGKDRGVDIETPKTRPHRYVGALSVTVANPTTRQEHLVSYVDAHSPTNQTAWVSSVAIKRSSIPGALHHATWVLDAYSHPLFPAIDTAPAISTRTP